MPTDVNNISAVLLSTIYHFVDASASTYALAAYTPPLSPRSSCGEAEADFAALSSGSSVSYLTYYTLSILTESDDPLI